MRIPRWYVGFGTSDVPDDSGSLDPHQAPGLDPHHDRRRHQDEKKNDRRDEFSSPFNRTPENQPPSPQFRDRRIRLHPRQIEYPPVNRIADPQKALLDLRDSGQAKDANQGIRSSSATGSILRSVNRNGSSFLK